MIFIKIYLSIICHFSHEANYNVLPYSLKILSIMTFLHLGLKRLFNEHENYDISKKHAKRV